MRSYFKNKECNLSPKKKWWWLMLVFEPVFSKMVLCGAICMPIYLKQGDFSREIPHLSGRLLMLFTQRMTLPSRMSLRYQQLTVR